MCGKKGASDKWKLNINRLLDRNKSEEAGQFGKVWFHCVELQLVTDDDQLTDGNFQDSRGPYQKSLFKKLIILKIIVEDLEN